jgi:hypothetical protein
VGPLVMRLPKVLYGTCSLYIMFNIYLSKRWVDVWNSDLYSRHMPYSFRKSQALITLPRLGLQIYWRDLDPS